MLPCHLSGFKHCSMTLSSLVSRPLELLNNQLPTLSLLSAGLLVSGWAGPSLCSTVMTTEYWAPSLRRCGAVYALWSSPPARESFPALWAPHPPLAPPVPLTTLHAAGPVTMATSFILVPAGQASQHPWTTIWTWTWTCLMLRFSEIIVHVLH